MVAIVRIEKIGSRDLLNSGKLTGVPITAGMLTASVNDLPLDVLVGIIAYRYQREHPGITYDQILDLIDEQQIEVVFGTVPPDPKAAEAIPAST